MNLVHVVGRRNHGKTTLVVALVTELVGRGLRVGTIKHSSHAHELDTPGKDSAMHQRAGAAPATVVAADRAAVFLPRPRDPYAALAPLYEHTELVLVEGDAGGPGPNIEVFRAELGGTPLADERTDIAAVVSDDAIHTRVALWPRANIASVADRLLELIALR